MLPHRSACCNQDLGFMITPRVYETDDVNIYDK